MAKFYIKISMDDETVVDDVTALMPDEAITAMVAACERLGRTDADNNIITGGRAITVAVRWYLSNLVKEYSTQKAIEISTEQAKAAIDTLLNEIVIQEAE